jgi:hypothetical protein
MKKRLSIVVVMLLVLTALTVQGVSASATFQRGDVNQDGKVNVCDVTSLVRIIFEITPPTPTADVNGDGSVDVRDITPLIRILLGE